MNTGIKTITIKGYKSISEEQSIDIKPLTILAGANSSGKSSFIQPLLLMKQTLEASYDAGPLLLNGSNINFTSMEQFLSKTENTQFDTFHVGIEADERKIQVYYKKENDSLTIEKMDFEDFSNVLFGNDHLTVKKVTINQNMTSDEVSPLVSHHFMDNNGNELYKWCIARFKCFLSVSSYEPLEKKPESVTSLWDYIASPIDRNIRKIIHLSGIRGNPSRNYPVTGIGNDNLFSGNFENYVASIIHNWKKEKNIKKLNSLKEDLDILGINKDVDTNKINDAQIEIKVSRSKNSNKEDLVNISDVGLGVSQALPILVALNVAKENQIVYIEQPELHLHPKAQVNMAKVLAKASKRGVKVVIETHSSLLLLAIQTLVAKNELDKSLLKLHWFTQDKFGNTRVSSADLDENGAFGEWPEDFGQVELNAESNYLDAIESKFMEEV